jgi:(1->4)-alpha-D-glucan 1-alpha-D-glucosylmutase
VARRLYESWPDGRIKLFLTQAGLRARRENAGVFGDGAYLPLEPSGNRADKIVAFARRDDSGAAAICIVPRLVGSALDGGLLPADAFADTMVPLPFAQEGIELSDAFTGKRCTVKDGGILVRDAFSVLPVALLLT